jgi:hypothetical protein
MTPIYHISTEYVHKDCYRINIYKFEKAVHLWKFDDSIDFIKDKETENFIAKDAHLDVPVFKFLKENNICERTIAYPFACCYHTKCIGGDLKLTTSFLMTLI